MKITHIKIKLTFFFLAVYLYKKRKALINRIINLKSNFVDFKQHTNDIIADWIDNYYKLRTELDRERDFNKNSRIRRRNRLRRNEPINFKHQKL